jgi:hypothetical protein
VLLDQAYLGGKVLENRKEGKRLAEQHVEALIRLFDPAYELSRIAVRRRYKGNTACPGRAEEGSGAAYGGEIMESACLPPRGCQARRTQGLTGGLIASVQTFLQKHDGGAVLRIGEGAPGHWQTAGYG